MVEEKRDRKGIYHGVDPQAPDWLQPSWQWKVYLETLLTAEGDVTITGLLHTWGALSSVDDDGFSVLCLGYTLRIGWTEVRSIRIADNAFTVHTAI